MGVYKTLIIIFLIFITWIVLMCIFELTPIGVIVSTNIKTVILTVSFVFALTTILIIGLRLSK